MSSAEELSALDQASGLQFNTEQVREARTAWIAAGHDAAKFDAAAKASGFEAPVDDPDAKAKAAYGLPAAPNAADYVPIFHNATDLTPERLAATSRETREWAAAIGFAPVLGKSIIEHLSKVGPEFRDMTPDAKAAWLKDQHATAIKVFGSEEAVEALKIRAKDALTPGGAFSAALIASSVFNSVFLLSALSNHARALDAFKGRKQ